MTTSTEFGDQGALALQRDRMLLRRYVRDGSEEAFQEIVSRYIRLVYATCLREIGDEGLAEDATQIVFLILSRKAPGMALGQSLAGWLFVTARYTAIDMRRREHRRRQHETELESADSRGMAYEDFAWSFIDPNLNDALMTLGGIDREAVLLRFFEQMTFKEVGSRLSLSEAAAERRVARALVKLRRHLVNGGFAASLSALAALLTERAARAVPAEGKSLVVRIALRPHAAPGALHAAAVSIAHRMAQSARIARMKAAALAVATAIIALVGYQLAPHPRPRAHTMTASAGMPHSVVPTESTLTTIDTVPASNVNAPSHHARAKMHERRKGFVEAASTASAPLFLSTPEIRVASVSKPMTTAAQLRTPPQPMAAPAVPSKPTSTSTIPTLAADNDVPPPSYSVAAIPDNDPQSLNYASHHGEIAAVPDGGRPVCINNNGEILYRCGDVYRWDGSSLTFERCTYGLDHPETVIQSEPEPGSGNGNPATSGARVIVQNGKRQSAVQTPPSRPEKSKDAGIEENVAVIPETAIAASIDDAGNVLGMSASGVFICPPGSAAYPLLRNPFGGEAVGSDDFHGRVTDSGMVAVDLAGVPGDYHDLSGLAAQEVSFGSEEARIVSLAGLLNSSAGDDFAQSGIAGDPMIDGCYFRFTDMNNSGSAIGILVAMDRGSLRMTPVCWSNGRIFKLADIGNESSARMTPCGIDDENVIVGYANTGVGTVGVLWRHGKAFNLNDCLGHSAWRISRAFAVNDDGDIVAWGHLGGESCAVLLTPDGSTDGIRQASASA